MNTELNDIRKKNNSNHATELLVTMAYQAGIKACLEVGEKMAKETDMSPHFTGGQTEFRKRFRSEALSDIRTAIEGLLDKELK